MSRLQAVGAANSLAPRRNGAPFQSAVSEKFFNSIDPLRSTADLAALRGLSTAVPGNHVPLPLPRIAKPPGQLLSRAS